MTREPRTSFTFNLGDLLFSLQIGSFCFEPSSQTSRRYLKLATVPSFGPFILISLRMSLTQFVTSFVFSTTLHLYLIAHADFVETFSDGFLSALS